MMQAELDFSPDSFYNVPGFESDELYVCFRFTGITTPINEADSGDSSAFSSCR